MASKLWNAATFSSLYLTSLYLCILQGRIQGGAAGGDRPSLRLGIRRPLSARRVLFLLVSEVLSLLSLLKRRSPPNLARHPPLSSGIQASSSTPGRPSPHQGALLHTRAPSSTPRHSPPHQSALLHTRALSCIPGSPTQHQGGLLHTRALSSTPGRPLQHQGALLHIRAPSSTSGCSPPHQDAFLYTWALSSTPVRPTRH